MPLCVSPLIALQELGQSEVGQLDRGAGADDDIIGLDVAVDHAMRMRVIQRARHFARNLKRAFFGKMLIVFEQLSKTAPFDVFHDQVGPPIGAPGTVTGDDIRMRQRARGFDFSLKSRDEFGVFGQTQREDFERDDFLLRWIARFVDVAHAAAAERGEDFEAAQFFFRHAGDDVFSPAACLFEQDFLNGTQFQFVALVQDFADLPICPGGFLSFLNLERVLDLFEAQHAHLESDFAKQMGRCWSGWIRWGGWNVSHSAKVYFENVPLGESCGRHQRGISDPESLPVR